MEKKKQLGRISDIRKYDRAHISAQEFAQAVDATRSQVLYWERSGFLKRNKDSGHRMFSLSEIPRGRLLTILVNDIGFTGDKAFGLANTLLSKVEDEPESVDAILIFLQEIFTDIDKVLKMMTISGFNKLLTE